MPGVFVSGTPATESWLRSAFPVLDLGGGLLDLKPDSVGTGSLNENLVSDQDVAALAAAYRRLLTRESTDIKADITTGAQAAEAMLAKFPAVFAAAGPLMTAMASEILGRTAGETRGDEAHDTPTSMASARRIAAVLLMGNLIDIVANTLRDGPLPDHADPVIVAENPENGMHPATIASLWQLLERVTWQKIVATDSDVVVGLVPLTSLRRIARREGRVTTWAVRPTALSRDALRKVSYHLRSRRSAAMFARCWVLVEGETEFWVVSELARVLGHDLTAEGVVVVEFAQSGVGPLLRLADSLGIRCHVLVDGDAAGDDYAARARDFTSSRNAPPISVTQLAERDIEHAFWSHGFDDVIRAIASVAPDAPVANPSHVIHEAIDRTSKPFLALTLIDAAVTRGASAVPEQLRAVIDSAISLARGLEVRED
jgi:putative ATP-dependent endonuclease of OLD family